MDHFKQIIDYFIKSTGKNVPEGFQKNDEVILLDHPTSVQQKRIEVVGASCLSNDCFYNHWALRTCL